MCSHPNTTQTNVSVEYSLSPALTPETMALPSPVLVSMPNLTLVRAVHLLRWSQNLTLREPSGSSPYSPSLNDTFFVSYRSSWTATKA